MAALYFTFLGFSGHLPSWVGGIGWAFMAVEKIVNMWSQKLINEVNETSSQIQKMTVDLMAALKKEKKDED